MSDTTKTPRTDAFHAARRNIPCGVTDDFYACIDFARELEREINALKHDLERAMANHNADLNREPDDNFPLTD